MIIKVTEKHIEKGRRSSCSQCPIALAIKDAGIACNVNWGSVLILADNNENTFVKTTVRMKRFINRFDNGKTVAPFAFRLNYKG